jgi:hypothetical protein
MHVVGGNSGCEYPILLYSVLARSSKVVVVQSDASGPDDGYMGLLHTMDPSVLFGLQWQAGETVVCERLHLQSCVPWHTLVAPTVSLIRCCSGPVRSQSAVLLHVNKGIKEVQYSSP